MIEEMGELIQSICRKQNKFEKQEENFIEELADVSIMLEQVIYLLTDADHKKYRDMVSNKIERTLSRYPIGDK